MISSQKTVRLTIVFLLFAFAGAFHTNAQPDLRQGERQRQQRKEAIEARRISYITTKLSLTSDEAKVFWPVYNEYTRKVEEVADSFRQTREAMPDPGDMTEEEAAIYVEAEIARFEESAALRRQYTEKLMEVISVRQIALLFEAERGFNRMLFREAQRRHRHEDSGRPE